MKVLEGRQPVNSVVFSSDSRNSERGSDGAIPMGLCKGTSLLLFKGQEAPVYAVDMSKDRPLSFR